MASDKNALLALNDNLFPDNTTEEITPADLRQFNGEDINSNLNLEELTAQVAKGLVNFTGGVQKNSIDLITGINEVEVLRAWSLAASQLPVAVSTPLQLEFGAAQSLTDVSIDASGLVTFNTAGDYIVRTKLNKGRTAGTGVALLFSRALLNTTQLNQSGVARITETDTTKQYDYEYLVTAAALDTLKVEIVRDSTGVNEGGVIGETSTDGWVLSPSALISVSRYEGVS